MVTISEQAQQSEAKLKDDLDQTREVEAAEGAPAESVVDEPTVDEDEAYRARLLKYDEHPGLLWDPVDEEWVDDPDYGGDE